MAGGKTSHDWQRPAWRVAGHSPYSVPVFFLFRSRALPPIWKSDMMIKCFPKIRSTDMLQHANTYRARMIDSYTYRADHYFKNPWQEKLKIVLHLFCGSFLRKPSHNGQNGFPARHEDGRSKRFRKMGARYSLYLATHNVGRARLWLDVPQGS